MVLLTTNLSTLAAKWFWCANYHTSRRFRARGSGSYCRANKTLAGSVSEKLKATFFGHQICLTRVHRSWISARLKNMQFLTSYNAWVQSRFNRNNGQLPSFLPFRKVVGAKSLSGSPYSKSRSSRKILWSAVSSLTGSLAKWWHSTIFSSLRSLTRTD